MTNPQTTPLPIIRNDSPIYDQLVAELGDPYTNDEEYELADAYYQEAKNELSKFVQGIYLEHIDKKYEEPVTDVIPVQHGATIMNPLRKHKR